MEHSALTWPQRGRLWLRLVLRFGSGVLALGAICLLGPPLLSLLAPFLPALGMAALLHPLVLTLQRRLGWSRSLISLLTVLVLVGLTVGLLTGLVYGLGGEVLSLTKNWEGLFSQSMAALEELSGLFDHLCARLPQELTSAAQELGDRLVLWFRGTVSDVLARTAQRLTDGAMALPGFLLGLAVFLMATYFLTAEYPYLRTRAIQHTDQRVLSLLSQIKQTVMAAFGGYLKAQLLLSSGVFVILLGGFLLWRQNYALLLALGLAILDFIPLLGAGTVMVPWAAILFLTRDYTGAIWVILIWSVVAAFRRLAEPKIVGDQTGLSPILSLVSIYGGMKLAGVAGMILGPILVLVLLNLSGIGLFRPWMQDLAMAAEDLGTLLGRNPEKI